MSQGQPTTTEVAAVVEETLETGAEGEEQVDSEKVTQEMEIHQGTSNKTTTGSFSFAIAVMDPIT